MTKHDDIDVLAARVRLRTAYVAAGLKDVDGQAGLRRLALTPRLTIYTYLFSMPEDTLLDVETDAKSLEAVFAKHALHSSVVAEFNVANGTNVRLRQGECVICRGNHELVSMKLTQDDVVTYGDQASNRELLSQTVGILDSFVHDGLLRCALVLHATPMSKPTLTPRDALGSGS